MLCRLEFCQKFTQWVFVFLGPKSFPPSNHPQNSNHCLYVDTNFEGCMIGMVGNHILEKNIWPVHVQADRQLFSDKTQQRNKLYGNEPLPQHYQQRFINISYRSDTVNVNYKRPLTQQLLHTIINNQNMSRKKPC